MLVAFVNVVASVTRRLGEAACRTVQYSSPNPSACRSHAIALSKYCLTAKSGLNKMQPTRFDARYVYADKERARFRLLDIKDHLGKDVFGELVEPELLFADDQALRIAIAGKLGLEPSVVDLRLTEELAEF